MVSHSELRKLSYSADAVCFDVDSMVIREEGIGELAKICGVEDVVSEIPGAVRHVNLKDSGPGWPDCWVSLLGHGEPWAGQCLSNLLSRSA
uniref:Phosphoserine phosphatase n=1 Tax=Theropithecus gelada TaxID=9565 RepID=A0A8D2EKF6_THEGE